MTTTEGHESNTVRCRCGPLRAEATYQASPRVLTVTMPFGTVKTVIGLQDPERLASRILRDRCRREAAAIASTTAIAARSDAVARLTSDEARDRGAPLRVGGGAPD